MEEQGPTPWAPVWRASDSGPTLLPTFVLQVCCPPHRRSPPQVNAPTLGAKVKQALSPGRPSQPSPCPWPWVWGREGSAPGLSLGLPHTVGTA